MTPTAEERFVGHAVLAVEQLAAPGQVAVTCEAFGAAEIDQAMTSLRLHRVCEVSQVDAEEQRLRAALSLRLGRSGLGVVWDGKVDAGEWPDPIQGCRAADASMLAVVVTLARDGVETHTRRIASSTMGAAIEAATSEVCRCFGMGFRLDGATLRGRVWRPGGDTHPQRA